MRILIVEDDPVSLTMVTMLVELFGHTVLTATDGAAAWTLFEREKPDVILSDWMMPEMDGVDFCRRVREASTSGHYSYFILITTLTDRAHAATGIEAGADDYLPKPIDSEQLRMRLIVAERVTSLYTKLQEQQVALTQLNQRLLDEGRTDPLTRLGNRLRLREDLERLPSKAARYGYVYAVMLCDVDHFKKYNDTAGHLAGDEVLRKIGDALAHGCRSGDAAYRYGGEEFLLILPGQSLLSGAIAAERLRRAIEALAIPHPGIEPGGRVTISVGVAALTRDGKKTAEQLLDEADQALYQAKREGRDRVVGFGLALASK